jgi:serine/threonine protein kinase
MAPEQFRNAKNADIRCDIYSLGATLYQMVTGELPFRSNGPLDAWMKKIQNDLTSPKELVSSLSDRVDWAIIRAMSADPNRRPASCREFVEDLTGHTTRRVSGSNTGLPVTEVWYLVYKDDLGTTHTVKGSTSAIRRSLKDGLLGDAENVRASRSKSGPFESLRSYPEFRDLLVAAAPLAVPQAPSRAAKRGSDPAAKAAASAEPTATPARDATAVPKAAPVTNAGAPLIALAAGGHEPEVGSYEWVKWVFLAVLALASAGVAYWLTP